MSADSGAVLARMERLNATARTTGVSSSVLQFGSLATHAQYRVPYAIAERLLRTGDHVLDWGCGNGHFSYFMRGLGVRICGFSFEPPPICMRGVPEFQFVAGSPDNPRLLPFDDATFDAVVGVGVLEHVHETGGNERASLAELARVVKPGGTLLTFHLPNSTGWIEFVGRVLRLKRHLHDRRFVGSEIRSLWHEAGFEHIECGLYNALPRNELRSLPTALRHSVAFTRLYNAVDDVMARVAPRLCTNFFVVARRPVATRPVASP